MEQHGVMSDLGRDPQKGANEEFRLDFETWFLLQQPHESIHLPSIEVGETRQKNFWHQLMTYI